MGFWHVPMSNIDADSRSDICIIVLSKQVYIYLYTACPCIHCYTLPEVVVWVSIVQSRQLGTHKHFYVYSHEALNGYFCITPHSINGL